MTIDKKKPVNTKESIYLCANELRRLDQNHCLLYWSRRIDTISTIALEHYNSDFMKRFAKGDDTFEDALVQLLAELEDACCLGQTDICEEPEDSVHLRLPPPA
ncbi:hypothetical protein N9L26_02065 [Candidatus Pacebacteria bacterium]|nr:hypothetical protein [Candidatus Paceibacterota bacterium]